MIAILCASEKSNYFKLEGLDIYTASRSAYSFNSDYPVIAHPPCAQWSRLRKFATQNEHQKQLGIFCVQKIFANGGILEQPCGSTLFAAAGVRPNLSIHQTWFGLPVRKRTYLWFYKIKPLAVPLCFDAPVRKFNNLTTQQRSETTLQLCNWLTECIYTSMPWVIQPGRLTGSENPHGVKKNYYGTRTQQ